MKKSLTPEQRKAAISAKNRRYYEKTKGAKKAPDQKKISSSVRGQIGVGSSSAVPLACKRPPSSPSKTFRLVLESPLHVAFSVLISGMLCYFQSETYILDGMPKALSYMVSATCEIGLCYLSVSLKRSVFSLILWVSLFSYSLATMSFGLIRSHQEKIAEIETKTALAREYEDDLKARKDREDEIFSSAKISFDIATQAGKLALAQKMLSTMQEIRQTSGGSGVIKAPVETKGLYEFQTAGLICLRAILMLLNAMLVHRIFKKFPNISDSFNY